MSIGMCRDHVWLGLQYRDQDQAPPRRGLAVALADVLLLGHVAPRSSRLVLGTVSTCHIMSFFGISVVIKR